MGKHGMICWRAGEFEMSRAGAGGEQVSTSCRLICCESRLMRDSRCSRMADKRPTMLASRESWGNRLQSLDQETSHERFGLQGS
jgi:hypothetical protein